MCSIATLIVGDGKLIIGSSLFKGKIFYTIGGKMHMTLN
jgi:hypothetical protein